MKDIKNGICTYCRKPTMPDTWSRQCFMTGELCSKQYLIQKEREQLHSKNEINAFFAMNISDMSDVVYKWKLRSFIESLKDYLYLNKEDHELVCIADSKTKPPFLEDDRDQLGNPKWRPVEKIHVIRADISTSSNYIICNRICQQLQIADLVVMDVSVANTSIFYEFGLAASLGKLILPICYNESFFQSSLPEDARICIKKLSKDFQKNPRRFPNSEVIREKLQHHIDCYPWRRRLFEHFGIHYHSRNSQVKYAAFDDVVDPFLGFNDIRYSRFPYDLPLENGKSVGEVLYARLASSYNQAVQEANSTANNVSVYNTAVLYTMDSFLNREQAGQCIINYYQNMTAQIQKEFCFCGDRVGVMVQRVDAPDIHDQKSLYQVSDIIRIGMSEATYQAQQQRIKTSDYLLGEEHNLTPAAAAERNIPNDWGNQAIQFTKAHVRNRCIPIFPDEPIYVQELLGGVQKGILSDEMLEQKQYDHRHFFCLFHVMLHTLRYTNEIVVDLSQNSLQMLFWLGIAHGRNTKAITVRHTPSLTDLRLTAAMEQTEKRDIFDVTSLWNATFDSKNTDTFFHQLSMAQIGIEKSSKLSLPETAIGQYQEALLDTLYKVSPHQESDDGRQTPARQTLGALPYTPNINGILDIKRRMEIERLESYYRGLFWSRMLHSNELQLYASQPNITSCGDHTPVQDSFSWEKNAIAELSHYLSKRTTIGCYRFQLLPEGTPAAKSHEYNFICIGAKAVPMQIRGRDGGPLVRHIRNRINENGTNVVRHLAFCEITCSTTNTAVQQYRGFFSQDGKNNAFAQFAAAPCTGTPTSGTSSETPTPCPKLSQNISPEFTPFLKHLTPAVLTGSWEETGTGTFRFLDGAEPTCELCQNKGQIYKQIAQLILWREVPDDPAEQADRTKYWVSLIGVSDPATLALTSLLVDQQQTQDLFGWPARHAPVSPLSTLQMHIREKLLERYDDALRDQLVLLGSSCKETISGLFSMVSYATKLYLSTVLYQYFFPFLTRADEEQLCNGMQTYVNSGGFVEMFDDAPHQLIAETVTQALGQTLSRFRGVEALYTVEIEYGNSLKPKDIRLLRRDQDTPHEKKNEPLISCLFTDP